MARLINPTEPIEADVGVNLGRADRRVTEKVLHYPQVRSALKQVSGEGMAQSMRRDRFVDSGRTRMFQDDAVHRA